MNTLVHQLGNGLSLGMMYALLALGFSLVYGIVEVINFAHFNVFMVGTLLPVAIIGALQLSPRTPGIMLVGGVLLALVGTMIGAGVLGVITNLVAVRPLRGASGVTPMITTIGVSFILQSLALVATNFSANVPYPDVIPAISISLGAARLSLKTMMLWSAGVAVMLGLNHLIAGTWTGKAMRASAQDPQAAGMMGIHVDRLVTLTFFIGAALAGVGGFVFGFYYGVTSYNVGYLVGLRAFTAAVLGGIGNIPGAVLGGMLIGIVEALSAQWLGPQWSDVIIFGALVFVIVLRPNGLLGRRVPRRS